MSLRRKSPRPATVNAGWGSTPGSNKDQNSREVPKSPRGGPAVQSSWTGGEQVQALKVTPDAKKLFGSIRGKKKNRPYTTPDHVRVGGPEKPSSKSDKRRPRSASVTVESMTITTASRRSRRGSLLSKDSGVVSEGASVATEDSGTVGSGSTVESAPAKRRSSVGVSTFQPPEMGITLQPRVHTSHGTRDRRSSEGSRLSNNSRMSRSLPLPGVNSDTEDDSGSDWGSRSSTPRGPQSGDLGDEDLKSKFSDLWAAADRKGDIWPVVKHSAGRVTKKIEMKIVMCRSLLYYCAKSKSRTRDGSGLVPRGVIMIDNNFKALVRQSKGKSKSWILVIEGKSVSFHKPDDVAIREYHFYSVGGLHGEEELRECCAAVQHELKLEDIQEEEEVDLEQEDNQQQLLGARLPNVPGASNRSGEWSRVTGRSGEYAAQAKRSGDFGGKRSGEYSLQKRSSGRSLAKLNNLVFMMDG